VGEVRRCVAAPAAVEEYRESRVIRSLTGTQSDGFEFRDDACLEY